MLERTGKNLPIFTTLSIVPSVDKELKVTFQIVKITFTMKGECVTLEVLDKSAKTELDAIIRLNAYMDKEGVTDYKKLREIVKELKEEKNGKA